MEIEFTDARWQLDMSGTWLSLRVADHKKAVKFCGEKKNKPYIAKIIQKRNRRSLDANAYLWVLCGMLGEKVRLSPREVYRQLIRDAACLYANVKIPTEQVEKFIHGWEMRGIGCVCDNLGQASDPSFTNLIAYYGSSEYDTKEMARLIDMAVLECHDQGIETMSDRELSLLKEEWRK